MNFYDFFYLFEIAGEDPMSMNTDDIQLQRYGSGWSYTFEMDQENYTVNFSKTEVYCQSRSGSFLVTNDAYSITLSGPEGYKPTGRGKPLTVYKNLIKAVKKLLDQENPEGLQFYGAYPEQDIMYAAFYEKYLSKAYTKLNRKDYLRNTFLEQLKAQGGTKWEAIEQSIEQEKQSDDIEVKKQNKLKQRERRQQLQTRLPELQQFVKKISWDSVNSRPTYVTGINTASGEVNYRYLYGTYLEEDATEQYDRFKPIDQMPNDPANVKKLQKLYKKLKNTLGDEPQFFGTPPEGWGQQTAHPMDSAANKIALHDSYGPVFVSRFNDDNDEVSFKYISGRYLENEYGTSDRFSPIDQLRPEQLPKLRKLAAMLQRDGYNIEFWGTPPTGWETSNDPHRGIEGKIAYQPSYGPVFVYSYDEEDQEAVLYYVSGGQRYLQSTSMRPDGIEKIDALPDDPEHYAQLRKLVKKLQRDGHAFDWYGTPPADYDQFERRTQDFEGKIAYSYDYGPVLISAERNEEELDEDEYEAWYVYGRDSLENVYTSAERIQPIDRLPRNYVNKLRKLVELLRDRGTQADFYGTPPQGWETPQQRHPAVNKIAWSDNKGPIFVHEEDEDEDGQLSVTYWSPTYNRARDGYINAGSIEPLDNMEPQWGRALQQLVAAVERGRGTRPQFFGTPPQQQDRNNGSIAWTLPNNLPVYVLSVNGTTAHVLYVRYGGSEVEETNVSTGTLHSFDDAQQTGLDLDNPTAQQKIRTLQQALQRQGITNIQYWRRGETRRTPTFES